MARSAAKPRRTSSKQTASSLNAALRENDLGIFLEALRGVVDDRYSISEIAKTAGLNRESLYRMLSRSGNPRFASLLAVLSALDFRLSIEVSD
jgi:probable addiction module antidote protein